MKDYFLEKNGGKVSEEEIQSKIKIVEAMRLEDYNKIFSSLSDEVSKEGIKLVVIDNIASVCDHFIRNDSSMVSTDYIERATFL